MTKEQYHHLVANYDRHRIEALIARIPQNVNRAGRHYRKLVKEIYENYNNNINHTIYRRTPCN